MWISLCIQYCPSVTVFTMHPVLSACNCVHNASSIVRQLGCTYLNCNSSGIRTQGVATVYCRYSSRVVHLLTRTCSSRRTEATRRGLRPLPAPSQWNATNTSTSSCKFVTTCMWPTATHRWGPCTGWRPPLLLTTRCCSTDNYRDLFEQPLRKVSIF